MKKVLTNLKAKASQTNKKIVAIFAVLAAVIGVAGYAIVNAGEVPEHHKSVIDNGDGTYKISLDITGDADTTSTTANANILIIYDVSSSMTGYRLHTEYGNYSCSYATGAGTLLYKRNGNSYTQLGANEVYTGTVYRRNGYGNNYTEVAADDRCSNVRRADAAEKTVYDFVHGLFAYKDSPTAKNIEMAMVTFSGSGTVLNSDSPWTSTESDLVGTQNNQKLSWTGAADSHKKTYTSGTNWEDALSKGLDALAKADDDPTYIVFVTDGEPTSKNTSDTNLGNYTANRYYYAAIDEARSVQTAKTGGSEESNTTLYTIYAFGDEADYLDDLTYYAHNGSERTGVSSSTVKTDFYYDAGDVDALEAAIDEIFEDIVDTLGVTTASIADGTTNNVKATSGDMNYNLLSVDEESYEYWLSMPVTSSNGTYTMTRKNAVTAEDYTITLTDNGDGTISATWEGHETPVVVTGTISKGVFKYKWEESNDLYKLPAGVNVPEAELVNGTVEWDLASVGTLLDGVTYTVTFDVWPSQYTLDLVADIRNELVNYSELDQSIKDYLKCDGEHNCTLYTNTEATITWTDTRDENPEETTTAYTDRLDPVATTASKMTIKKLWDNQLPGDTHGDTEYPKGVTFKVVKDGNAETPYDTKTLTKAKSWTDEINISAGVIQYKQVNGVTKALIREVGHDYTFAENPDELNYHWDLEVETVRPMIINGVLTTLVKVEENAPEIDDTNMLTANGVTYYKLPDKKVNDEDETTYSVYYVREENAAIMNATNVRRSNLNITKEVTGEAPEDAEFTFKLKVKDALNANLWFSIYDPANGTVTDDSYVTVENAETFNKEKDNEGAFNGYYEVSSEADITVTMKANWNLRFTNLPLGSTYTFEEINIPDDFIYDASEGTTVTVYTDLLPVNATDNGDGTYTYNGTTYTKVTNEDGSVSYGYDADITKTSGEVADIVNGIIYTANNSYVVKYTNEYELTNINVVKVWDDEDNQDGKRPESITVRLFQDGTEIKHQELTSANALATTDETTGETTTDENTLVYTFTDLQKFDNGREILYTITEDEVSEYDEPTYDNSLSLDVRATGTKKDETVNVKILANGEDTGKTATLNKENNYKTTIDDLDYLDDNNNIIAYTYEITNESTARVRLYTRNKEIEITNKHTPEVITKISGEKIWEDEGNTSIRPDSITVTLTGTITVDGKEKTVYGPTDPVTVNAASNWKYEFTNLDRYAEGVEIDYVITEGTVNGYTTKVIKGELIQDAETGAYSRIDNVTNTLITTEIPVTKVWVDNSNQDGKRPTKITIRLFANGTEVQGKTVELTSANAVSGNTDSWTYTYENLNKKDANGNDITYTVKEDEVKNTDGKAYTKEESCTNNGCTITNTLAPEKVKIIGTKTWVDNGNTNIKPSEIEITLTGTVEGVEAPVYGPNTIKVSNDEWTFDNLDRYSDGKLITYTLTEKDVPGYEKDIQEGTFALDETTGIYTREDSVTNTLEETSIPVTKVWADNSNQDGKRPTKITIRLFANGTEVQGKAVELTSANAVSGNADSWTYTYEHLNKKDASGNDITYTVSEDAITTEDPDGTYTTSIASSEGEDGVVTHIITNRHDTTEISIPVTKIWDDGSNQDGKRPESITINLLANGTPVTDKTATLTTDNAKVDEEGNADSDTWVYTFEGLSKYADGQEITYTITEDSVKDYSTRINGFEITNSYTPKVTEVVTSKTWIDNDDQDGLRPDSITVRLLADGTEIDHATVTEEDNFSASWTDLPRYKNGKEITYTITEDEVDDYTTAINGYAITNTHTPAETKVNVSKVWSDNNNQDGERPDSITVRLLADDTEIDNVTITPDEDGNWEASFDKLPKYRDQGTEIVYTVSEDDIDDENTYTAAYSSRTENDGSETHIITNSHTPAVTSVSGTKTWDDNDDQDGKRPESITIRLLADGTEIDDVTVTEEDDWAYSFTGLPKYRDEGTEITYTVTEDEVDGYETTQSGNSFTNTYSPETTSVSGTKTWDDNDDQDGVRPESITIRLLADGTEVDDVTVTEEDDWAYSFTGLPKYRDQGTEITYTVTEDEVDGYETTQSGNNFTNKHTPELTDVSGKKVWSDSDDLEGYRPESITVRLLADGTEVEDKVAILTADDANDNGEWIYSFTELPKYRDGGEEIVYTVSEDEVANYTTTYVNDDNNHPYIIINEHVPSKGEITVKKVWDTISAEGIEDPYGHATEIEVTLEGKVGNNVYYKETVILKEKLDGTESTDEDAPKVGENWTYTFENLPEYREAKPINYTVTEDTEVTEYNTTIESDEENPNMVTITNKYNPGKVTINGTKTWDDSNNQDGKRPESITVNLLADGEKIDTISVTSDENGDWKYTFDNLPKMHNKQEIVYTVTEEVVAGYETVITPITDEEENVTGYTITNSHTPETVSFKLTKIWLDNEDNDGKRPESITVRLLANGEEIDSVTVTPDDNGDWKYEFKGLPKYNNGEMIVYTIEEDEVADYTTEVTSPVFNEEENSYLSDITNTHEDETIDIVIIKTWDDYDDVSNIRPTEIEVDLLADEEVIETYTITEEDDWTITIMGLPKYLNGEAIVYTIYEHEIPEYETTINGDAENGFEIINHHELGKGGDEEDPPQTGIDYIPTKNSNILYIIMIIMSILGINVEFLKNN